MSCSDASLPIARRSGRSASSGDSAHGEDVVEHLAGVGQHRRAVAADVADRAARPRTSVRVAIGMPALQRRRPTGEQRTRVEERQRRVDDVAADRARRSPPRERPVRAKRPCVQRTALGSPGRPGGEDRAGTGRPRQRSALGSAVTASSARAARRSSDRRRRGPGRLGDASRRRRRAGRRRSSR